MGLKQSPSGTVSGPFNHPSGWPDPEFSLWDRPPLEIVLRKRKKAENYAELLRDPRWQKARLETMQRAGFACERCGDKETTLNVHHKNYKRNHAPWEYELSNFVCLCRDCHEIVHKQKEMINNLLPYVQIDIAELMSALVANQDNGRYVGQLHPRVFSYEASFYLGILVFFFNKNASLAFIEAFTRWMDNDAYCEDLNRLVLSYEENSDEH